jgi:MoaA/NifB/PqqE/SkfB family radical SAM enzyme
MSDKNRFLVRREYFGGLIYDRKTRHVDLLNEWQYRLLTGREGSQTDAGQQEINDFLEEQEKKGVTEHGKLKADSVEASAIRPNVVSAPIRTYYHITFGCNLNCTHCMVGKEERGEDELTTEEAIDVIRQLEELGNPELRITGGEPTIRPDLFEIIHNAAIERNMNVVMNTNGVFNDKVREKIAASGLDGLVISVDGNREIHDQIRRQGSFDQTIRTINYIAEYNETADRKISICLNPTISRKNVHLTEYLARLAVRLGGAKKGLEINFMPLRPFGNAENITSQMLTAEGWYEFSKELARIREIPEIKESGVPIYSRNMDLLGCYDDCRDKPVPFDRSSCGAATFRMGLSPNGQGNVCGFIGMMNEFKTPSTRHASILEIWHSPAFEKLRHTVKEPCEKCDYYRKECVGVCKAMSYIHTGELGKYDRYCYAHLLGGKNGCRQKD